MKINRLINAIQSINVDLKDIDPKSGMINSRYFSAPGVQIIKKTINEKENIKMNNAMQIVAIDSNSNEFSSNKSKKVELIILDD